MIIFENDRQYENDKRPFFNDLKKTIDKKCH